MVLKTIVGKVVFLAGWPFFWIYFRIWSKRTRVIVVHDRKMLLVKGWLSDGSWGLPGGGAGLREEPVQAASRELFEETGIQSKSTELQYLESIIHDDRKLKYTAIYFLYKLKNPAELTRQKYEIAEIGWFDKAGLSSIKLNVDARYARDRLTKDLL